jgi:hypothetical protein
MPKIFMRTCKDCGEQDQSRFYLIGPKDGSRNKYLDSYCIKCKNKYNTKRKKGRKAEAVAYLGGKCNECGLVDDCIDVYDFHHKDQNEKDFTISQRRGWSFERLKVELDKCVLLCANCHRRIHSGKPLKCALDKSSEMR